MPPGLSPSVTPQPPPGPGAGPGSIQPAQQLGRLLKLPVKVAGQPPESRKGWLGVDTDVLDLPLALSLGRRNADGALVTEAAVSGPADQAGVRFGDIIVRFNDKPIGNADELRQQVASTMPGDQAVLEVWRVATDDGDFLQTLRRLGAGGNAHVMYRLGRMYAAGTGVARDESEAARWYRKGADAGNANAMTALAVALFEGRGAAKDVEEAVRLLKTAASKENPEAMSRLAVLLVQGKGVDKDPLEGMRLLIKAAGGGFTPAMVDLGLMYNHGLGIQADVAKAAAWYKRAADLGNPAGMLSLGVLHQQGKGVAQSDFAAATLYRKAADLGNSQGIHNLAALYDSGKGVERRDPERAAELLLRALELRNQFSYQQMTTNSHSWSPEFRRALQRKLADAGYFKGRIDGLIRAPTITAINGYVSRSQRTGDRHANGTGGRSL